MAGELKALNYRIRLALTSGSLDELDGRASKVRGAVTPFHLFRYFGEGNYCYNNHKLTKAWRFDVAVKGTIAQRLTLDQPNGTNPDARPSTN
jgi:hypothetical protein